MPKKRGYRPQASQRGGGNSNPASRSTQRGRDARNPYAPLAEGATDKNEEMNSHVQERFSRNAGGYDPFPPDPMSTPLGKLPRANQDIEKYFHDAEKPVPGAGDWLKHSEIPTSEDIQLKQRVVLPQPNKFEHLIDVPQYWPRPNKVEGAYTSKEEYLSTQYDLLREDALTPLRNTVKEVRHNPFLDEAEYPQSGNVGIYDPVYITGYVFSTRGLAVRVAFSLNRVKKYIRWKQSKRLITGTLVALTPYDDGFKTMCVIATVAARPLSALETNPPEIDLFIQPGDLPIDPMRKWIMVENRSSFFEASRHTLTSLQHLMREPFPLSEHIVGAKKEIDPPQYLQDQPHTDLSSLVSMEDAEAFENVNILQPQSWPSGDIHGLDASQSKALQRILTNRLAIVQGPPGTGKTYVSIVALKILLANKYDTPIIVTCQTNHALDQLLRHVAEFEPNFIRLGGRSKDTDKVKKRTLFEVRNSTSQIPPGEKKKKANASLRHLTSQMQILLAPLEMGQGCLDPRALVKLGLITEEQAVSLEIDAQSGMGGDPTPGIQMEHWLGKCLVPSRRPIQADDFGLGAYEEEDLEVEQLQELEAEAVARDDDDIDALKGPVTSLCDNQTGKGKILTDQYVRKLLDSTEDLTTIHPLDRGGVYKYFQRQTKGFIIQEFRELAKDYQKLVELRKIGQWEDDQRLLASQRLIGLTTTGLSKYRPLITSLRPKIILVEEAAETLEAPITAACVPTLDHLILVGDHQQLRPHCQTHKFEDEPYYFNLSLFERMIFNDIEIDCLARQRRMIPEIRRLLYPIYQNTLQDHSSVTDISNRPPVEGMGGNNSFFFTHEWPESRNVNMSCQNELEADMIVGFFDYLVCNGVDPEKVTVLTFYNGQRSLLLKKLRFSRNLRSHPLNVCTVDSYQGEENDIIILSLVRSSKRGGIGFLENDNRACVALSRARRGFYLFGNGEKLATESNTWADVVWTMYGKANRPGSDLPSTGQIRRVGFMFPLKCMKHNNKTWIQRPDDWEFINGGCDQQCDCTLPCGHRCVLRCHPFPSERINCMQMCQKRMECGHVCKEVCSDPCKCETCDRRYGGLKPTLKGNVTQLPMRPSVQAAQQPNNSGRNAYPHGGARLKDGSMQQANLLMNVANDPQPLIQLSPRKEKARSASYNTNLLVDLDLDIGSPQLLSGPERRTYKETYTIGDEVGGEVSASGAASKNAPAFNLLD